MKLIDSRTGEPIKVGDIRTLSDERQVEILLMTPPHKPSSTGRVYVKFVGSNIKHEYFPSVVGGEWVIDDGKPERPKLYSISQLIYKELLKEGVRIRPSHYGDDEWWTYREELDYFEDPSGEPVTLSVKILTEIYTVDDDVRADSTEDQS